MQSNASYWGDSLWCGKRRCTLIMRLCLKFYRGQGKLSRKLLCVQEKCLNTEKVFFFVCQNATRKRWSKAKCRKEFSYKKEKLVSLFKRFSWSTQKFYRQSFLVLHELNFQHFLLGKNVHFFLNVQTKIWSIKTSSWYINYSYL